MRSVKNSSYWLVGILAGLGGYTLGYVVTTRAVARLTPEQLRSIADAKARAAGAVANVVRAGVPS
jgi:hypothetical protein